MRKPSYEWTFEVGNPVHSSAASVEATIRLLSAEICAEPTHERLSTLLSFARGDEIPLHLSPENRWVLQAMAEAALSRVRHSAERYLNLTGPNVL